MTMLEDAPRVVDREMSIVNQSGDTKLTWDSSNATEVEHARSVFEDSRRKGFIAYATKGKTEALSEFDPSAEKMVLAAPFTAG